MPYGVTADGFVDKPIETILSEIEAAQKDEFGDEFDVSSQSPAGQLNGIFATHLREVWEVMQAIYTAWDPDANTGEAQTQIAALTGTVRLAATKSTVTATVNLDAGVTLAAGAIASVTGAPTSRFVTTADATNGGGAPANVNVAMEAETAGIVVASAGTLTVIETPQSGWNSVTNAADATLGTETETDEDLRTRREEELRRAGAAAVDAIAADIRAVDDVTSVTVFENTTDVTDGDGVPPHAIEAVVLGGTANAIAQAIWDSVAGGIERHGGTSGTAVDDDGNNQTVEFTRPTEKRIHVIVEGTKDADYPADGDAQIKAAIVAWGDALGVGVDVVQSLMYALVTAISGVTDVTKIWISIDPVHPPVAGVNLSIGAREISTWDTTDIDVTMT